MLIIDPVDPDGVAPSLAAAKAANIPVIAVDRNVHGTVVSHIGRNNAVMGNLVGQAVVAWLGKNGKPGAKINEIQGAAGDTVMKARRDGFNGAVAAVPWKSSPITPRTWGGGVTWAGGDCFLDCKKGRNL